ncbi:olfactory receptor 52B2-like [Sturnira hondurensis]|uniref:olfactory receptor 52B2-like n=1 Tax=Sturnira hondurensis TaxID=192404 RepID=UPI00187A41EB|nr:olfactory receptor 52B2-like [Sturnira hondurensis]
MKNKMGKFLELERDPRLAWRLSFHSHEISVSDENLTSHRNSGVAAPIYSTVNYMFVLIGIPGLRDLPMLISVPFCLMYLVAVAGNAILICVVAVERSLHEPMYFMYFFLALLALWDLILSSSTVPKALRIFWLHDVDISFGSCVTQLFFTHFAFVVESGILLAMAFDHYVAICYPLMYTTTLNHDATGKIGGAVVIRSFATVFSIVFLVKRLPFCRTDITHTFCEHIGLAKQACADITNNIWYGISVPLLSVMLDMVTIVISYGLILWAVFKLPSRDARMKALSTCGSHVCVILMFYLPGIFTVIAQCFGRKIPKHVHILLADLFVLVPPMMNPIIYGVKTKQIHE